MGKLAKEKGVADPTKHKTLNKICKKYSHTGNKPLVQSLADPNVMVTQKVRKAQESNRNG
tara:strand:- start:383 stop:562 length:180 start_codon:yes stop_codon:yes gene_type:complete